MRKIINLTININEGKDMDAEELDFLTRQLLQEIRDLEIESADIVKDKAIPRGAKSAEAVSLGTLSVALLPAIAPKFIDFLQTWSLRGDDRSIKVETKVGNRSMAVELSPSNMSTKEVKKLLKALTGGKT